ncbi:peptidoglycan editing factor PgeF [Knoellia aerolata]|uniref:Purine nucleoside phosphorylase n=1 Tax=Knoellia aerolata DSM 18566 TaxID=1385519 RepID=A0A0A0JU48_9MICO|nr:peptidoglycan editing factor PgeF [Knoellia aerolata]KGN40234.1 laccase [Knoellia aerolata DSM 18566]
MFFWRDDVAGIRRAFTDRSGGVSLPPYAGLNLGGHVGDAPEAVRENRARVVAELGVTLERLVLMDQCHGADVAVVSERPAEPLAVDGVVTAEPGLALAVLVADCTPVLLSDEGAGVIGAVHAGRPGMTKQVVPRAVSAMRDVGASRIRAVVGPSVCGRCYEVPLAMREEAAAVSPESRSVTWTGTPAIDVASGVVAQLRAAGVDDVTWVGGCAREEPSLYSYRRDGTTGRFAGLIVRTAP